MSTDRIPPYAPTGSDEAADLALGVIQKGGDDIAALALMLHAIHLDLQALDKRQAAAVVEMPETVQVFDPATGLLHAADS